MVYRYTLAVAGFALLLALLFYGGSLQSPAQSGAVPPTPVRLKIPTIHVDAAIVQVGLTPDGAMDAPKGPGDVGWFTPGKRPGEIGSAVMDGHFGWKDGIRAVFDNLSRLRKGDKIYVIDTAGTTAVFIVRDIRTYDPNADASSVFGSNDGTSHLNLITCEGAWNAVSKTYADRLVVFADKE